MTTERRGNSQHNKKKVFALLPPKFKACYRCIFCILPTVFTQCTVEFKTNRLELLYKVSISAASRTPFPAVARLQSRYICKSISRVATLQ